jgi:hypothetical protein
VHIKYNIQLLHTLWKHKPKILLYVTDAHTHGTDESEIITTEYTAVSFKDRTSDT